MVESLVARWIPLDDLAKAWHDGSAGLTGLVHVRPDDIALWMMAQVITVPELSQSVRENENNLSDLTIDLAAIQDLTRSRLGFSLVEELESAALRRLEVSAAAIYSRLGEHRKREDQPKNKDAFRTYASVPGKAKMLKPIAYRE